MKFTITNKMGYKRNIPCQGNYAIPIGAYETKVLDYNPGAEGFYKNLADYDYDIKIEESDLDTQIKERFSLLESKRPSGWNKYTMKESWFTDTVSTYTTSTSTYTTSTSTYTTSTSTYTTSTSTYTTSTSTDTVVSTSNPSRSININSAPTQTPVVTEEPKVEATETIVSLETTPTEEEKETKDTVLEKCKDLSAEQLRDICREIGINTTSNNTNTLFNKISNRLGEISEKDFIKAYHTVVG